jgi:hypothetical protein
MQFTFARKGGDLVASLNGGAETAQKAQARHRLNATAAIMR